MNNMKKIFLIIIILFFFFTAKANAQVTRGVLLVTPFKTEADFDILFPQSTRVLAYLEGIRVEEPLFISLSTIIQKENLEKNGFKPRVIDENADLSRYVLLYSQTENQESSLTTIGEPIKILKHFVILRLPVGKVDSFEMTYGVYDKMPFLDNIQKPPKETPVQPETITKISPIPITEKNPSSGLPLLLISGVLGVVFVVIFVVVLFIIKRKKQLQVVEDEPGVDS